MVDIQSAADEIRLGKKKIEETTGEKYNVRICYTGRPEREYMVGNICELECGPMPNLMVALPNIGGALCSMPQNLAHAHY